MKNPTRSKAFYTVTETVDVDIDIDFEDIIGEIPTEMLEAELAEREDRSDATPDATRDELQDLIEAIRGGDRTHLRVALDRWMPGAGSMI